MEDVKLYIPKSMEKREVHIEGAKEKFKLYPIISDTEKLKEERKRYIEMLGENVVIKILSSTPIWYSSGKVFDFNKELNGRYYEFCTHPIKDKYGFKDEFIEKGPYDGKSVLGVNVDNQRRFFYTAPTIYKYGKSYIVEPSIEISEDLFNIYKILFRDFSHITLDDISKYREFFSVSNEPYMEFDEEVLEESYRLGNITLKQYKEKLDKALTEQRLVKTLRK